MMALPAMVLEAEAPVVARLHPAMQAPAVRADFHICLPPLPRSRGGLRQMVRAGPRVRLASTCVRFSSAIGDGVSFLASQDPA